MGSIWILIAHILALSIKAYPYTLTHRLVFFGMENVVAALSYIPHRKRFPPNHNS